MKNCIPVVQSSSRPVALILLLGIALIFTDRIYAQGTAFTYQGQLATNGLPANSSYDLTFSLFTAGTGAGQVGTTLTNSAVAVSNGLFTVVLDFGANFPGLDRWLEVSVRASGSGSFNTLSPRQRLTPTPYAIYSIGATTASTASNATTASSATSFTGNLIGDVTGTQGATVVSSVGGQSSGNVAGGASAANAATSANTANTLVKRDASGNLSAGTITATLSGNAATATTASNFSGSLAGDVTGMQGATVVSANIPRLSGTNLFTGSNTFGGVLISTNPANLISGTFTGPLAGNVTGNLSGNATTASTAGNFTGSLAGDVTGTQGATAVASVGGQPAASIASGASAANAATSANTPGTIVKRDGSGSFAAGTISAGSVNAGTFAGDGGGVTNLNGANIVSGTVGNAQLGAGAALANLQASGQSGVPSGGIVLSTNPAASTLLSAGYIQIGRTAVPDSWLQESTPALEPRTAHAAVWTGSNMIVWGGANATSVFGDGALYNPASDTWTPVATNNAPSPRANASVVWTGTEMIIWGGAVGTNAFTGGARYNPQTGVWIAMSTNGAPAARELASAVWTGSQMLIWGGLYPSPATSLGDGASYNPATDTWSPIASSGAPLPRVLPAVVWTGSNMIIWGGASASTGSLGDGASYNPASNSWAAVTSAGAPTARADLAAVWTGTEMIVFGGNYNGTYQGNGAVYNPASNSWTSLSSVGAPSARIYNIAVWTGSLMLIWGGYGPGDSGSALGDGAAYNVGTGTWYTLATYDAPSPRDVSFRVLDGDRNDSLGRCVRSVGG